MKNMKKVVFVLILSFLTFLLRDSGAKLGLSLNSLVLASHCPSSDYDCQITEIQTEIDTLKPAHEYNKKELSGLNSQISDLKKKITSLSSQLVVVEKNIL